MKEQTYHVELTYSEIAQIEYLVKLKVGMIQYAEVKEVLESILKKLKSA